MQTRLKTIPLASAHRICAAHMITPSGVWRKVAFDDGALQTTLLPAQPRVFRLAVAGAAMPA